VRVFNANWMQIEEYLRRDDRIVLPAGSTEQHGCLSLGTDAIPAERVAAQAAGEWVCPPGPPRGQVLFHGWCNAQTAAAGQFDHDQMHGGWVENFRWTRGAGADLPAAGARMLLENGWAR
jgi:hypothetical protein